LSYLIFRKDPNRKQPL